MKRTFDVVFSLAGVVFLAPLFILIGIVIRVDSPGPVFYRGMRVGFRGRKFRIFKFRTMVADAEMRGGTSTAHRDVRITRIGHFLRRYKIDELPQLFNVIRGEMSLVGPRPEVEEHTCCYTEEEQVILSVRPGITDNASIRFVNLGELLGTENPDRVFIEKYRDEKNRLRVEYVKTRSFLGDVGIIFRTLFRVTWR